MYIEETRRKDTGVTTSNSPTAPHTVLLSMLVSVLLSILSGCAAIAPNSNGAARANDVNIDPALQRQLYQLEDQAEFAIKQNHLTYPKEGSAVSLFEQMLTLNPGNKEAIRGLEQVVEEYVALALAAANERLFAKAKAMLARAKLVDANHPSIAPTMKQIHLLEKAKRKTIQLNAKQLFTAATKSQITTLVKAGSNSCHYAIAVNNDEQGRWIYRAIKDATFNSRPKARIIISSPTRIEQICLTTP